MVTNNQDDNNRVLEPSSSLHTKLQTIIDGAHQAASERGRNDNYTIMLIEQAFQEAGYIKLNVKPGDIIAVNAKTYSLNGNGTITEILHMTGQEFYDSYVTELGFGSLDTVLEMATPAARQVAEVAVMKCDEAAKRAARLEKGL